MTQTLQAVRGMNDILPTETAYWQHVETIFRDVLQNAGFNEIRTPIVERTELFKRSIGEVTDIVEKEMYTFTDRSGDSLTLRPEGTACIVRAALEHGLLHQPQQRLWYGGPYFRHERPQKGRYRQFYQYAAEVFGLMGPDIDAEIIALSATLFQRLGLLPHIKLQLNSLGTPAARLAYRNQLVAYLTTHQDQLDEESRTRLQTNPLRILDSKRPELRQLIEEAPKLIHYLDEESHQHFAQLQAYLTALNIPFEINPYLVRGLDYYTKTVFEWVTDQLGAQGTVCAGGRYDGLVEQLGGKSTPALGFAFGIERAILLMQTAGSMQNVQPIVHAYLITDGEAAFQAGLKLAHELRNTLPHLHVLLHCGGGSFKNQFKKADKSGAQLAIIIGEEELATGVISVKYLREEKPQKRMSKAQLVGDLAEKYLQNKT